MLIKTKPLNIVNLLVVITALTLSGCGRNAPFSELIAGNCTQSQQLFLMQFSTHSRSWCYLIKKRSPFDWEEHILPCIAVIIITKLRFCQIV